MSTTKSKTSLHILHIDDHDHASEKCKGKGSNNGDNLNAKENDNNDNDNNDYNLNKSLENENKSYDLEDEKQLEELAQKIHWLNGIDNNDEEEEKTDFNLENHIANNELKACFKNCSLDGDDHIVVPGLRDCHVDRYITDGRRTVEDINVLQEAKVLVRDAKVFKITEDDCKERTISTSVIGKEHGIYKVSVTFSSKEFLSDVFIDTLQIEKCDCVLLKGINANSEWKGCGENNKCKHVAALLYSIKDPSSLQQPLRSSIHTPYKVKIIQSMFFRNSLYTSFVAWTYCRHIYIYCITSLLSFYTFPVLTELNFCHYLLLIIIHRMAYMNM